MTFVSTLYAVRLGHPTSPVTTVYSHNHGAVSNSIQGNCAAPGLGWQQGPEKEAFADYVKGKGHQTGNSGKYLNQ